MSILPSDFEEYETIDRRPITMNRSKDDKKQTDQIMQCNQTKLHLQVTYLMRIFKLIYSNLNVNTPFYEFKIRQVTALNMRISH